MNLPPCRFINAPHVFKTLIENNFEPLEFEQKTKPCRYWATYIKKLYEVDPLICKRCGAEMKIKRLWPAAMSLGHAVFAATQKLRKSLKLLILKTREHRQRLKVIQITQ